MPVSFSNIGHFYRFLWRVYGKLSILCIKHIKPMERYMQVSKGGRPRRTDLYRKINFHCTAEADAAISYVLGNAHVSGLPMCTCRGDAIVLCILQVADMLRRERSKGEVIPWRTN